MAYYAPEYKLNICKLLLVNEYKKQISKACCRTIMQRVWVCVCGGVGGGRGAGEVVWKLVTYLVNVQSLDFIFQIN